MDEYVKKVYTSEELVEVAIKRIKLKRSLHMHIASYVFVNAFLIFLYYMYNDFKPNVGTDEPGFLMVIGGWGLGLAFHIFNTVQDLKYKYNTNALENELKKVRVNIDSREDK